MAEFVDESPGAAGRWELSREALDVLLRALGPDRNAAARCYEDLRRRLIDFFSWRGEEFPEELADETLNRLARRLLQGEPVEKVERYALGIARLLLKESARRREQRSIAFREIRTLRPAAPEQSEVSVAFERCLAMLSESSRSLIARYYGADCVASADSIASAHSIASADRIVLAGELGLSSATLRTRALRIRKKLYECITARHKG